jgi:hypothetical protein
VLTVLRCVLTVLRRVLTVLRCVNRTQVCVNRNSGPIPAWARSTMSPSQPAGRRGSGSRAQSAATAAMGPALAAVTAKSNVVAYSGGGGGIGGGARLRPEPALAAVRRSPTQPARPVDEMIRGIFLREHSVKDTRRLALDPMLVKLILMPVTIFLRGYIG